ncbi:MAG: nucleotidyl transferase AbiEii/AbiGii toxin family protein [Candidatus Margulisbacteria bacterium]|nr:nucleotidyl transferase AbiEii/AbiGii toxin family protein [Candidatus Margulisiibacteriota bacterium]
MADKYPSIFHLIAAASKAENVSCVIIGGFAINYYKVTRQTADVDFLITKEDFKKLLVLLEKAGYEEDYSQTVFTRLRSNDQASLMDVDFMFVDKATLLGIIKDGEKVKLAGQSFVVPSLNHLLALKLHSLKHNLQIRINKDIPDIIELARVNNIDVKGSTFRELCEKYGTKKIYSMIIERM